MKVIIDWKNLKLCEPDANRTLIIRIPHNSAQGIIQTMCIGTYVAPHSFIAREISTKSFYKKQACSYAIPNRLLENCYWDYYAEDWTGHLYSNMNELLDI